MLHHVSNPKTGATRQDRSQDGRSKHDCTSEPGDTLGRQQSSVSVGHPTAVGSDADHCGTSPSLPKEKSGRLKGRE